MKKSKLRLQVSLVLTHLEESLWHSHELIPSYSAPETPTGHPVHASHLPRGDGALWPHKVLLWNWGFLYNGSRQNSLALELCKLRHSCPTARSNSPSETSYTARATTHPGLQFGTNPKALNNITIHQTVQQCPSRLTYQLLLPWISGHSFRTRKANTFHQARCGFLKTIVYY